MSRFAASTFALAVASATLAAVAQQAPATARAPSEGYLDGNAASADQLWLAAVDSVSATDAWAVGYQEISRGEGEPISRTLVEHWDGAAWSRVPSPNPRASKLSRLTGVDAVSATDVWAVGYFVRHQAEHTVVQHWDGEQWSIVPSPNPGGGSVSSHLTSVLANAADDVWAVGSTWPRGGTSEATLITHWDGVGWSRVSSGHQPRFGGRLNAVTATSATDVWAAGIAFGRPGGHYKSLVQHWDGDEWTIVTVPQLPRENYLNGIAASTAADVWAVGSYVPSVHQRMLALHWGGADWVQTQLDAVEPGYVQLLFGVSAATADDVWTIGYAADGHADSVPVIQHWDGDAWSSVSCSCGSREVLLTAISASATDDAWIVGAALDGVRRPHELFVHWDGTTWSRIQSAPAPTR